MRKVQGNENPGENVNSQKFHKSKAERMEKTPTVGLKNTAGLKAKLAQKNIEKTREKSQKKKPE